VYKFSHYCPPIGNTDRGVLSLTLTSGEVLPLTKLAEKFSYRQYRRRSSLIDTTGGEVLPLATLTEKFSYWLCWRRSSPIGNADREVLPLTMLAERFSYRHYSQMKSTAMSASLLM